MSTYVALMLLATPTPTPAPAPDVRVASTTLPTSLEVRLPVEEPANATRREAPTVVAARAASEELQERDAADARRSALARLPLAGEDVEVGTQEPAPEEPLACYRGPEFPSPMCIDHRLPVIVPLTP